MQEYRYFTEDEFNKVGCSLSQMNSSFMSQLDEARELAGVPFVITSAFRSKEDNERVGGSPTSLHLSGRAVDISCATTSERGIILRALFTAFEDGIEIGIYPRHIHVGLYPCVYGFPPVVPRVFIANYSNSK